MVRLEPLVAKGLVTDKGRVDGAGRAKLYVTTSEFLDAFGLNSLEDLQSLLIQRQMNQIRMKWTCF